MRESAVSMENLKLHILDIWEAVRRRNKRMGLPAEIFNYYGLPLDGTNPRLSVREEWLQIGREMVSGDANAVADGNPAILNPSAPELQTAINKAQDDLDKIALADRAYDLAQAAVAEFRPRADEFIDEVFDQLLFALRKMDNPSQRRVIRSYGYKYDYSPDEPPEEVPDKPEEFDIRWEEPQVTVGCEEINTAVTYEFVYSLGDDNWLPLYTGAEHSYTYDPPAGRRMYKVRAENEIGAGEWSDELEFTVPG
ncbi:MAG: hypothetical protein H8E57_03555 [Candidatus Cloacimonetes bacterium]|nr:hypothetical protein [Candidatus Cloacimonadota bacterium]